MRLSRFSLPFATLMLAVAFAFSLPARVGSAVWRFAVDAFDTIAAATDVSFLRGFFGLPVLAINGPDRYLEPSLATNMRHEAGLARL